MATWQRCEVVQRAATALLLASCLLHLPAPAQIQPVKGSSMKITHQPTPRDSNEIDVPITALRRAALPAPPPAAASGPPSYAQPYANERQNGRVGAPMLVPLARLWRTELAAPGKARQVLAAGATIVVQSSTWQSFGPQGQALATSRSGAGPMYVNGAAGIVYSLDPNGFVAAHAATTGKREFIVMPGLGDNASFVYLLGRGRELLLAGASGPRGNFEQIGATPPSAPLGPVSMLELVRLPENTQSAAGSLLTGARTSRLEVPAGRIVAARSDDIIVFAVEGAVFFVDRDLNPRAAYAVEGTPLALSLDEAGRAYLVLDTGGRRELRLITPGGDLGFATTLPSSTDRFPLPAVIGYDHRVFVASRNKLLALDPSGRELWSHDLPDKPAGLVIAPDGMLLVSEGEQLAAYDTHGKRSRLFDFPGERLATPAAVTSGGGLLLATDKALYSLGAR